MRMSRACRHLRFDAAANAANAVAEVVSGPLPREDVQGFDWTVSWATLEPTSTSGAYQWSVLDTPWPPLPAPDSRRRSPSCRGPRRRVGDCSLPQVTITLLHTQKVVTIAVPPRRVFSMTGPHYRCARHHLASLSGITPSRRQASVIRVR